jgi:WD40 repeat protein
MKSLLFIVLLANMAFQHKAFNDTSTTVTCLTLNPSGNKLFVANSDGTAYFVDPSNGGVIKKIEWFKSAIHTARFSADGKKLITTGADKSAKIWDVETGKLIDGRSDVDFEITSAIFSPNDKLFLTVSATNIKIWSADTIKLLQTITAAPGTIFTTACFTADNKFIYTGSSDETIQKWIIGYEKPVKTMSKHTGMISAICISKDGKYLASSSILDSKIHIWDAKGGFYMCSVSDQVAVSKLQSSNDGKFLLAHGAAAVTIIRFADCTDIASIFDDEELLIRTATFNVDASQIYTANSMDVMKVWDVKSGSLIKKLR